MMHGHGKSDHAVVAGKPANNAGRSAAEPVEPRAGTKGNTGQQSVCRTQGRANASQALERIRQAFAVWTRGRSRMRESCMYGSERGARGNSRPYRDRREFIATFGAAVLGSPIASLAQRLSQRTPKIGLLLPSSSTSARFSLAAFREGLQALGYQEGQNLVIEYRWAEGRMDRLPALATELVEQKVEVIVAGGFVAAQAAKNATLEIP